ncbi:MAG: hypothetical protein BroJett011_06050 [Chloroflexota bacterium]|nr:MAG: hypothetical protein BroJett011_06050 [Chloroflexota bacterium]
MTICSILDSSVAVGTEVVTAASRFVAGEGGGDAEGVTVEEDRTVDVEGSIIIWTRTDSTGGAGNWYES